MVIACKGNDYQEIVNLVFDLSIHMLIIDEKFEVIDMARKAYQILVIPIIYKNNSLKYCVLKRRSQIWQFVSGGGEEKDKCIEDTVIRELYEECNINEFSYLLRLKTQCSISVEYFEQYRNEWGDDTLVIPEYSFAVFLEDDNIILSQEHDDYKWVEYDEAKQLLEYDSNKVALWEAMNLFKRV